jgi:tetratricopeptide (TPR) repeat protein
MKKKGNTDKAIELLTEAVKYKPYDASYLMLAELYSDKGEFQKSLDAANNALKYRGKRSKLSKGAVYYYKGLALKGLGNKEEAKKSFSLALTDRTYKQNAKYELKMLDR